MLVLSCDERMFLNVKTANYLYHATYIAGATASRISARRQTALHIQRIRMRIRYVHDRQIVRTFWRNLSLRFDRRPGARLVHIHLPLERTINVPKATSFRLEQDTAK